MITKLTKEHLEYMRIPRIHWGATLEEVPKHCPHKKLLTAYTNNIEENIRDGIGLLLHGAYSMGKTGLASIILKSAADKGFIGFWVYTPDLAGMLIQYEQFSEDESVSERINSVSILVLDELVFYKDKRDIYVEEVIRRRISQGRTTIITTNLAPSELQQAPALAAIVKEAIIPITVEGHDFRLEKKNGITSNFLRQV